MRPAPLALLALAALLVTGCTECSTYTVQASVGLTLDKEEARTLPILTSGATHVGPVNVPDSHGWLDTRVHIDGNFTGIDISSLRLTLRVAGQDVPVKLQKIDGGSGWHSPDDATWSGGADDGTVLRLWWTVDRSQVSDVRALRLPENAAYTATVDFAWRHTGCGPNAAGHVTQPFNDTVEASVNARAFDPKGTPQMPSSAAGVGLQADYAIRSGLEVHVTTASAQAVVFHTGPAGLALVTFPHLGTLVDGAPGSDVKPGDTLRVQSTAPLGNVYAPSGSVAPPGTDIGGGLAVLVVELSYTPTDPTLGATHDTFAYGIDT